MPCLQPLNLAQARLSENTLIDQLRISNAGLGLARSIATKVLTFMKVRSNISENRVQAFLKPMVTWVMPVSFVPMDPYLEG